MRFTAVPRGRRLARTADHPVYDRRPQRLRSFRRARWDALGLVLAFLLLGAGSVLAQTGAAPFPALSGRVVDAANLLQPAERSALEAKLKAFEDKTSDQLVVATVPTLGGNAIEDYANRLFRHWELGRKKGDNGVLFLVAPNDRKVRIEVGYGLEGTLTDAISSIIIRGATALRIKAGDYAGGITGGVDAIMGTLSGDTDEWQRRAKLRDDGAGGIDPIVAIVVFLIIMMIVIRLMRGGGGGNGPSRYHRTGRGAWIPLPIPTGGWSGGGGFPGGGFSGGGFSGGGGSSGGGGASGSW